jgi:serine O-acetyltransferase
MNDNEIIELIKDSGYRISFRDTLRILRSDLLNLTSNRSTIQLFSRLILDFEFHLVASYRLSHYLYINKKLKVLSKIILYYQHVFHSCDIHPSVRIGKCIRFPHPQNIVLGQRSIIGNHVRISHNVTLGGMGRKNTQLSLFPKVHDNVRLFTGCILIGGIVVEKGVTVGAYALVNKDVNEGSTVVGNPAVPIRKKHE